MEQQFDCVFIPLLITEQTDLSGGAKSDRSNRRRRVLDMSLQPRRTSWIRSRLGPPIPNGRTGMMFPR